jgi:anti-anti-sigma regulatory factor
MVNGSLDTLSSCQQFVREIKQMPLEPNTKVALDLGKTSKYSGSFLGFLIEAIRHIRSQGADIVLVTNDSGLLELMDCCGITKIVSILPRVPAGYYKSPETWIED